MSTKKNLGTLVVVVLKARHLKDSHTFYKQDPYAVIQLGSVKHQTKVEPKGGQHPVWDDEFRIDVYNQPSGLDRKLKISVYSKEYKNDELIGETEVDISETLRKGEFDEWVTLELDKSFRGEIYLEMTYYSAEPPPLVRRPSKLLPKDRLSRPPVTPPKERTSPYLSPQKAPITSSGHLTIPGQPDTPSGRVTSPHPTSHPAQPQELPPSLRVPKIHPGHQSPHPSSHVPTPPVSFHPGRQSPHPSPHVPTPPVPSNEAIQNTSLSLPFSQPSKSPSPSPASLATNPTPLTPPPKFQDPTFKNIPFLDVGPQPQPKAGLSPPKPLQHVPSVLRPTHFKSSPIPVQPRIPPQLPPRPQDPQELFRRQLEESDAEFAAKLAESEGVDVERLRMEEEDAELARRLAAEEGGGEADIPGAWR